MFIKIILAGLLILGVSGSLLAQDPFIPVEYRTTKVDSLFVPDGFDENDDIEVTLDGYLADGCHHIAHAKIDVKRDEKIIQITQYARKFHQKCIKALVPFTNTVRFGPIERGVYQVVTNKGELVKTLRVNASDKGPDDFPYAPVESVSVFYDEGTKEYLAHLKIRFTSTCVVWDEAHPLSASDQGDTILIQPIVKEIEQDDCQRTDREESLRLVLPQKEPGRYLLHVRSMSGAAKNTVYSVYK